MQKQLTHFLLVPDSSAARRLRRLVAVKTPRMGIQIGTWPELIEQARSAYLISPPQNDWKARFHNALGNVSDAFWSKSFESAPQETATEVETALSLLVSAVHPVKCDGLDILDLEQNSDRLKKHVQNLPDRPRKRVQDLVRLLTELDGRLPVELDSIRQLFNIDSAIAIRHLVVYHKDQFPVLTRWQALLIEKLNQDADAVPDLKCLAVLDLNAELGPAKTNLDFIKKHLFSEASEKTSRDESVQWLGVRDHLEEAEVAAGMVQRVLADHSDLSVSEIGLLVPDKPEYSFAVNDAFSMAGIPLSGLPDDCRLRNLGKELLFHFLYCQQTPAPAMALAACLSSPLMPWEKEQGEELAQTVMDGNYRLQPFESASKAAKQVLALLRGHAKSPKTLAGAIRKFVNLLEADQGFESHLDRAKVTAEELCTVLRGESDINWALLCRLANPQNITTEKSPDFNLNGVTVWREGYEPWRPVRFLFVLGFASEHYPSVTRDSTVFASEDLTAIRQAMKLSIMTPAEKLQQHRDRFKRQLAAASEFATFLVPRRNSVGRPLSPSESLVFMFQLFTDIEKADTLILDIDVAAHRERMRYLPRVDSVSPTAPREIVAEDIRFDIDLLTVREDETAGLIRPVSPSGLETLMVSPLAWLLRRIGAEPTGWAPDRLDVLLLGTLTHSVFEKIFKPSVLIPDNQTLSSEVERHLNSAISEHAPFLKAAQWQLERKQLVSGTRKAVVVWREVLKALNAEILGSEKWLRGTFEGHPIHGQVDILLWLPDERLLVVDYKRSSGSIRKKRMENGYDSQAELYRMMLRNGGLKDEVDIKLNERIADASSIGVVYFTTMDAASLSDTVDVPSDVIPTWERVESDVSENAMRLIRNRLQEVSDGQLYLNREGDSDFFDGVGVKPYALDSSPLISMFTLPGESRQAE